MLQEKSSLIRERERIWGRDMLSSIIEVLGYIENILKRLSTKDETSETTVQNLLSLVSNKYNNLQL